MRRSGINLSLYRTLGPSVSSPARTYWRWDVSWMLSFIASSIWKPNKLSCHSARCSFTSTFLLQTEIPRHTNTQCALTEVFGSLVCTVRGAYIFFFTEHLIPFDSISDCNSYSYWFNVFETRRWRSYVQCLLNCLLKHNAHSGRQLCAEGDWLQTRCPLVESDLTHKGVIS